MPVEKEQLNTQLEKAAEILSNKLSSPEARREALQAIRDMAKSIDPLVVARNNFHRKGMTQESFTEAQLEFNECKNTFDAKTEQRKIKLRRDIEDAQSECVGAVKECNIAGVELNKSKLEFERSVQYTNQTDQDAIDTLHQKYALAKQSFSRQIELAEEKYEAQIKKKEELAEVILEQSQEIRQRIQDNILKKSNSNPDTFKLSNTIGTEYNQLVQSIDRDHVNRKELSQSATFLETQKKLDQDIQARMHFRTGAAKAQQECEKLQTQSDEAKKAATDAQEKVNRISQKVKVLKDTLLAQQQALQKKNQECSQIVQTCKSAQYDDHSKQEARVTGSKIKKDIRVIELQLPQTQDAITTAEHDLELCSEQYQPLVYKDIFLCAQLEMYKKQAGWRGQRDSDLKEFAETQAIIKELARNLGNDTNARKNAYHIYIAVSAGQALSSLNTPVTQESLDSQMRALHKRYREFQDQFFTNKGTQHLYREEIKEERSRFKQLSTRNIPEETIGFYINNAQELNDMLYGSPSVPLEAAATFPTQQQRNSHEIKENNTVVTSPSSLSPASFSPSATSNSQNPGGSGNTSAQTSISGVVSSSKNTTKQSTTFAASSKSRSDKKVVSKESEVKPWSSSDVAGLADRPYTMRSNTSARNL